MDSLSPIENTSESDDTNLKATTKGIQGWGGHHNTSYSKVGPLFVVKDIRNLTPDDTLLVKDSILVKVVKGSILVKDSNGDSYSISFDIENQIFEIDNKHSFEDTYSNSWNTHIKSCIGSYLQSQIGIDTSIVSSSDNYSDSYISSSIYGEIRNNSESEREGSNILTHAKVSDFTLGESSNDTDGSEKYKDLWVLCEDCYEFNYKEFLKLDVCEHCEFHFKMSTLDRIELSIDPGTWDPMDEDMVSADPLEFEEEEESYKDYFDSYQWRTGVTEAVQTGIGQLNGIPVAVGIMDFQFMGGSMGCVVGEKITRLIEYATNKLLPLIIVCASGGARMQEGSLSLMQMAKISSALYDYKNKKLFYVSILTSPTTGGVTASFGMLGDIIIAEPNALIAFAGKRVIEETLKEPIPEGSQLAEPLFEKGLCDLIVPRKILKSVLGQLFAFHGFLPLNQNSIEN
uniref:acetyl-CoA carboxylase beta subunit n=1 Tax=Knoxia roxburghii TaxID=1905575 RepID=UPI002E7661F0|nr:acetyl-CoA carboxylase beta subunit [Knoxia roxburghii]WQH63008.1 acetyl-CoA carboxylase beta subunit [Knoxia roxburghii]